MAWFASFLAVPLMAATVSFPQTSVEVAGLGIVQKGVDLGGDHPRGKTLASYDIRRDRRFGDRQDGKARLVFVFRKPDLSKASPPMHDVAADAPAIATVPLPASGLMLLLAMVGLAAFRGWKRPARKTRRGLVRRA